MPTSDIRNFIAFAQGLAEASGTIIREAARQNNAFVSKGDDSPVTEIDRRVETELRRRIGYLNGRRLPGHLEGDVDLNRAIHIDDDIGSPERGKSAGLNIDVVPSYGEGRKRIEALIVRLDLLFESRTGVDRLYLGPGYRRRCRVLDHPGDPASDLSGYVS